MVSLVEPFSKEGDNNFPFSKGEGVKKLRRGPLTLPSPARREGKDLKIQEEIPSPSTGEGQGGGDKGIFSHLQGNKGDFVNCRSHLR